jgi:E2/UBC family protein E
MLPAADNDYLAQLGIPHEQREEQGVTCLVFPGWTLPPGYDQPQADLLIRLMPGYPDVPPDMWWFSPAVHHANGAQIEATQVTEPHLGRNWQRWSRHFQAGQWRSGTDSLESYLALIRAELRRCSTEPA